jgi:peptidyl-tRNA hydrolase, PTH1 family
MTIKLIVGLRNPGATYQHTRHNAGEWFVERLVKQSSGALKSDKKMQGETADLVLHHTSFKVLLPLSYMNLSGASVRAVCQFYRLEPQEVLVAHDDLDLPAGGIKLKTGGGHGGHNGLRDIISQLGSSDFHRLRIGIGHPGHKELVLEYVLGKPSQVDRSLIIKAIDQGLSVLPMALTGLMTNAMSVLGTINK